MRLKLRRISGPPFRLAEWPAGVLLEWRRLRIEEPPSTIDKAALRAALSHSPLDYRKSGGWLQSRPDQCAHWSARGQLRLRNCPALTGDGRRISLWVGGNGFAFCAYRAGRRTGGRLRCWGVMLLSIVLPIILLISWILSRACLLSGVGQPA